MRHARSSELGGVRMCARFDFVWLVEHLTLKRAAVARLRTIHLKWVCCVVVCVFTLCMCQLASICVAHFRRESERVRRRIRHEVVKNVSNENAEWRVGLMKDI